MESSDVPAPGSATNFSADEIIVYGVALGKRMIFDVKVVDGGTNYAKASTTITTNPVSDPPVEVELDISGGVIRDAVITNGGSFDAYDVPEILVTDTATGAGAKLVPYLKNKAILNLEEGRWDIAIEGVRDLDGPGARRLPNRFTIVAAYGYAFEGHCYRFDRPRLLGFEHDEGDMLAGPIGCGFDPPVDLLPGQQWYKAWRIRSNKRMIELSAAVARADELILEANKPGRRPPNTYSSLMRLAHRGGHLTSS